MKRILTDTYSFLLSRRSFRKLNRAIAKMGLKGLGLLFHHDDPLRNGELFFAKLVIRKYKVENVFDVGANKGSYCKMLLDIGFTGNIHCFEPHPRTFNELEALIKAHNVRKYSIALSYEPGSFPLYDHSEQDGSEHASLFKDVIEGVHKSPAVAHQVIVNTLDLFVQENNIERVGLLKMDTEGNEYNVLRGATELIKGGKIDIIHFEFNEMNIVSRVFLKDFMNLLEGFNFYRLLPNSLLPLDPGDSLLNELFSYQNIVAIRKTIDKEIN